MEGDLAQGIYARHMCPIVSCKVDWVFPNVTRQELNIRRRPILDLTFHVRKTGTGKTVKDGATERKV